MQTNGSNRHGGLGQADFHQRAAALVGGQIVGLNLTIECAHHVHHQKQAQTTAGALLLGGDMALAQLLQHGRIKAGP